MTLKIQKNSKVFFPQFLALVLLYIQQIESKSIKIKSPATPNII